MATARQYIETAAGYIGVGGTDNVFNTWIWGQHVYDPNRFPWCAAFQSYVGVHDLGMPFNPSASAAGVAWQGERVADSAVRPGDWVLFNWDGSQDFGWAHHIGLVEWSDINGSGLFGTIEGNTGGGEGRVMRCTRNNNGGYAPAFFRPPYEESEEDMTPEQASQLKFIFQHMCWDDSTHYSDMGNLVAEMPITYPTLDAKGKEVKHTAALGARIGYIDQRMHAIEGNQKAIMKKLDAIAKKL